MLGSQTQISYILEEVVLDLLRSNEIFSLSEDSLLPSFIEMKFQCYHKRSDSPQNRLCDGNMISVYLLRVGSSRGWVMGADQR